MFRNIIYSVRCFSRLLLCGVIALDVVSCFSIEGLQELVGKPSPSVVLKAMGRSVCIGGPLFAFRTPTGGSAYDAELYDALRVKAEQKSIVVDRIDMLRVDCGVAGLRHPLVRTVVATSIAMGQARATGCSVEAVLNNIRNFDFNPKIAVELNSIFGPVNNPAFPFPTGCGLWFPDGPVLFCSGVQATYGLYISRALVKLE
jgi:hypothetical protein